MTDTPADPLDGTSYRTKAKLGEGGMGEVFLAEHRTLGRLVVVKIVHAALVSPAVVERMRVEAQILGRLSHPNIVEIFDIGETRAKRPYLVMERLVGRTLGDEVAARGALPVWEAVATVRSVLDALLKAHEAGIVHRDVKADNVFLHRAAPGERAVVKLLDFGIAKVLGGGKGPLPTRFPTEEGALMGTPRFCSPEQALGSPNVDHRADIYAVGALLYFLVTGYRLFAEKTNLVDLLRAHAVEVPRPVSQLAPVSPAVDAVVERALAKRPADRFGDAAEMDRALAALELKLLPRTVRIVAVGPEIAAIPPRTVTEVMSKPARAAAQAPLAPPAPRSFVAREPRPLAAPPSALVDRFRFAIVFAITVLLAGALGIALVRFLG